ncbi:glutamate receptor ionotropic, kainate glr-3-like [Andrena cerasifolii]|uniref:glutamate receptor ionotropic, kainate glr-3-like n=1 Tax=Andrena cerasifolii TaxID=2819439 RepID=UPI004038348D
MLAIIFAVFYCTGVQCQVDRSMIWNRDRQDFVALERVPGFGKLAGVRGANSVAKDISGKAVKVSYYEERDLVMFHDNDTRVAGVCGEIWNLLADQLNFTLVIVKSEERNFGVHLANGSYNGLLGLLERNETQVIMRTGYYAARVNMLDYTFPIWATRYRLYIKPAYKQDNKWIVTMFSHRIWYVLVFLFTVLSVAGYVFQNEQHRNSARKRKLKRTRDYFGLNDHFFYTYSVMCGQGYLPSTFHNQNKILSFSKSMFAWLILLSFSSNLIYRMTYQTVTPPFTSLETLLNKTNYKLLAFKGSMVNEFLTNIAEQSTKRSRSYKNRIRFVEEPVLMHQDVCRAKSLTAMLETEDKIHARNKRSCQGCQECQVIPMGQSYFQTWIGFALQKRFPYKKLINTSILKLHETGLIDVLKDRWLEFRMKSEEKHPFKTVDIQQVYFILCIPCIGAVLSLVILCLEKIVFFCEAKRK